MLGRDRSPIPSALRGWLECKRCKLSKFRRQVVLGRGVLPAHILLIGEAPGPSEDLIGDAFIGRAGRLLNKALGDAADKLHIRVPPHYATNIVACKPCDELRGKFRAPLQREILACKPRLEKTIVLARPERIILLGKVAQANARGLCPDGIPMIHPSALLRMGQTQSPHYKKLVRELGAVFKDVIRSARSRRIVHG